MSSSDNYVLMQYAIRTSSTDKSVDAAIAKMRKRYRRQNCVGIVSKLGLILAKYG